MSPGKIRNYLEPSERFQWHSLSKEIFQRVLQGATWLSESHNVNTAEKQPLLQNTKLRTVSLNDNRLINGGHSPNVNFPSSIYSKKWPPSVQSHKLPVSGMQGSVSISDVCRTATPMLPPLLAAKEGVSWVAATFLLVNAALGIGILNFPAAYNQAGGILSATIIQVVMLFLIIVTMLILAYCSDVNDDVTYHDVLMSMCGSKAQKLAAMSITCTCYGVGVAILIIIGDQLDRLFLSVAEPTFCHHWYLNRQFTIPAVSVLFVLPMCYCKRVDFLRYAGSLGIFAMLYPVFLTVYGYFTIEEKPETLKTAPDDVAELFDVIPVLCLAYQCQEVVVPVYSCLKERTIQNFAKSCFLSMAFLLVIYSIIGCFGYLTFGARVYPNVMKMYNADDPIVMIGVGALIIKMIVTYPVLALCGRGAVDGLYAELRGLSAVNFLAGEKKRRIIIASLWFMSSLLIALSTNSIGPVVHLLGAVSSANIFIYPGLCLMCVILKKDPELKRLKSRVCVASAIILVAFGTFCFGVVLASTILYSSNNQQSEVLCS